MNLPSASDETTSVMAASGFNYTDEPAVEQIDTELEDDADAEFQPRLRARMHWLTRVLIVLASMAILPGASG